MYYTNINISYDLLIWLGLIITLLSQILIKVTYSKDYSGRSSSYAQPY